MTIVEYFDITSTHHLRAWDELEATGMWPKEFWAELEEAGITFPTNWHYAVQSRMADAWVDHALGPRGN